jgi:F-type H+-transporting ATPase subunit delta
MPLSDAQPDALAEVYARSLFELAEARGGREAIETALGELEDILELTRTDPRFGEFLASRVLPFDARERSLERIFKGRVSDLTHRFLQILNEKGRLSHLPSIASALDGIVQKRFGRVEVDVYTATPLGADELADIRARLQSTLGREPIVHAYTEPAMLGGVKFQIGDRLIDGSLATRLRKFREQLSGRGAAEIRARAERIIDDAGDRA